MDHLGGLVVIAPARRAGDLGSNPGPDEKFLFALVILSVLLYGCKMATWIMRRTKGKDF